MARVIDLRSDTVTHPTEEMRQAMAAAPVGDDVYGEDPTVNRLQELAAEAMGKEAALFVPSGTMGNQLGIMTHTTPGDEIIAGARSHIIIHENVGHARLSGVSCALVDNPDNIVRPGDVHKYVRPDDLMAPPTTLLCLENALTDGGVVPVADLMAAHAAAKEHNLAVHLDGARIFNAAAALGVRAKDIAAATDSVMFCLSKGLCAPVGSVLCGSAAYIRKATKLRKMLGGSMRQAGILAAAGIIGLEKMTRRLGEDHDNAAYLCEQLATLPGIEPAPARCRINMVFWKTSNPKFEQKSFVRFMTERGILTNGYEFPGEYRFVTHHGVARADIDAAIAAMKDFIAAC